MSMGVRVPSPSVTWGDRRPSAAGRALPFGIRSGELETIKWLALGCMLISHAGRFWFHLESGWPLVLGQLVFPLFAFCVALPLSRDPVEVGKRLAFRLAPYAVVCQILVQPVRGDHVLDVLFTYVCVGAWLASAGYGDWGRRWLVRALVLGVALFSAFWWPGVALVVTLTRWVQTRRVRWFCGAVAAFACIAWLEARWFGFAAFAVVAGVMRLGITMPRVRNLFARAYVGQYVGYWVLRAAT